MRAREFLTEYIGLGTPWPFESPRKIRDYYEYSVYVPNSQVLLVVTIVCTLPRFVSYTEIKFPKKIENSIWEIMFVTQYSAGGTYHMNPPLYSGQRGKLNAALTYKLLSTVSAIIKDFLVRENSPPFMYYRPKTEKLKKIYDRIFPKLLSEFGYKSIDMEDVCSELINLGTISYGRGNNARTIDMFEVGDQLKNAFNQSLNEYYSVDFFTNGKDLSNIRSRKNESQ